MKSTRAQSGSICILGQSHLKDSRLIYEYLPKFKRLSHWITSRYGVTCKQKANNCTWGKRNVVISNLVFPLAILKLQIKKLCFNGRDNCKTGQDNYSA